MEIQKPIATSTSENAVKEILEKHQDFKWIYLGKDAIKAASVERIIAEKGTRIETASLLQETARELRQPYIDYIGKLSVKNNSLDWWAGCLSEKNPYTSNTFLYACYLTLAKKLIKNKPGKIVFFVENDAVRKSLSENFGIENASASADAIDAFHVIKKFILSKGWFLVKNISRIITAKYKYHMQERVKRDVPLVAIHTFTNKSSFDAEGNFRERYFVGLKENLEKYHDNVVIMPYVWTDAPYGEIMEKISKSHNIFLVPHAFLSFLDIFDVFLRTLLNSPKKEKYPVFEGLDISEIIYDDLKDEWLAGRIPSDMLFFPLINRLKENHVNIDTLIHTHENHTWEKVLHLAMRTFYPNSYTIGYQHVPFSQMTLNYFFSEEESGIVPLPDRIVTTGKHYEKVFSESCYPMAVLKRGGALRYQYLLSSEITHQKTEKSTMVVTFSADKSDIAELLLKLLKAIGNNERYEVLLKFHPFMPFEKVSEELPIDLPGNFAVVESEFRELLGKSNAIVYTGSATAIEAMAAGVYPLHVASDFLVDADRLDFNPELRFSAKNSDELLTYAERITTLDEKEFSQKRNLWKKTVEDLFGKTDESFYRLFLR